MSTLEKICTGCDEPSNRANFHGGYCYQCNLNAGTLPKSRAMSSRKCQKCEEVKPLSEYTKSSKGMLYRYCEPCRVSHIPAPRYHYPDGFSKLMQKWISRAWL